MLVFAIIEDEGVLFLKFEYENPYFILSF